MLSIIFPLNASFLHINIFFSLQVYMIKDTLYIVVTRQSDTDQAATHLKANIVQ